MAFYCNGKKDMCDCDTLCADCGFFDNSGGQKTLTNADRIRAMSDEELAKLLLNACIGSKCGEQPMNEYGSIDCFACRMKWLKQPAEVEDA